MYIISYYTVYDTYIIYDTYIYICIQHIDTHGTSKESERFESSVQVSGQKSQAPRPSWLGAQ